MIEYFEHSFPLVHQSFLLCVPILADVILHDKQAPSLSIKNYDLVLGLWLGLPARYNSGYIRTRPPLGQPRRQGADQSHAWVGGWLGPDRGWVDLDPTNGIVVRDEHVLLGWGRDYADVSPVQGVILGGGAHRLSVSVDLEPDEEPGAA